MILNANKTTTDQIKQWQEDHPGQVAPAPLIAKWKQMSPNNPVAQQMEEALHNQQKTQELTSNLQSTAQKNIEFAKNSGYDVDPEIYKQAGLQPPGSATNTPPANAPISAPSVAASTVQSPVAHSNISETDRFKNIFENGSDQPPPTIQSLEDAIKNNNANGNPQPQKQIISSGHPAFNPLYTQKDAQEGKKLSDAEVEKNANDRLTKLFQSGDTPQYSQSNNDILSMQKMIHDNPQLAQESVGPIAQKSGLVGGILSAAQSGLGFGFNGLSGHIELPVSDAIVGSYDKDHKNFYSALSGLASKVSRAQQNLSGINPNAASNQELNLQGKSQVDPSTQLVPSISYNLENTRLTNDMNHEMAMAVQQLKNNEHPKYAIDPNSRTPTADILSSPAIKEIADKYAKRFQKNNENYLSSFKK
jgi:hypothetical protein